MEEQVKAAILQGLSTICFTEHLDLDSPFVNSPDWEILDYRFDHDEYRREYLYTAKHGVDVHLYGQFACWAPAQNYEDMYLTVFSPMIRGGAVICDDLKEELRINQEVIDRRNRAIREETRKIAEDNRATLQVNLEKGKAFREELQRTADTIRIAWLNQNSHNRQG